MPSTQSVDCPVRLSRILRDDARLVIHGVTQALSGQRRSGGMKSADVTRTSSRSEVAQLLLDQIATDIKALFGYLVAEQCPGPCGHRLLPSGHPETFTPPTRRRDLKI